VCSSVTNRHQWWWRKTEVVKMAGVPVTITGVMTRTGLSVGGGPMPGGPTAEHPIAPGGAPPGFWGGVPPEYVDIGLPGDQPGIGGGPGSLPPWVMPPIVIPPEFISDVHPEHPIVIPPPNVPGYPAHPIVLPPDLDIWGPTDPRPTNPIVIPPSTPTIPPHPAHPIVIVPPVDGVPQPPEVLDKWDVVAYWTPTGGWGMAIVPGEGHDKPIISPSK
jgi:hypothetical protein